MTTILDADMRMSLWQAGITDEQIAELEKALTDMADGHAKMSAELALRIIKVVANNTMSRASYHPLATSGDTDQASRI
jgi:hypothetical protein